MSYNILICDDIYTVMCYEQTEVSEEGGGLDLDANILLEGNMSLQSITLESTLDEVS